MAQAGLVATFLDGLIAFDLQLATTQLPAIVARESFYERHGIRYVWVTSSNDAHNLSRQAFQDIYWNNDAQIFGIDERAEAITRKQRERGKGIRHTINGSRLRASMRFKKIPMISR